jgi:hypothetical protein
VSRFEDAIWTYLVDAHGADRAEGPSAPPTRRTPLSAAAGASVAMIAAVVVALLLILNASSGASPAYALTRTPDGSYTLSLYDISRAVPALNAKFARLGIRVTVVPVVAGCKGSFVGVIRGPGSMSETVTVGNRGIRPGWRGFLAAESLPDGHIGLAMGSTPRPIPSCFPTTTAIGIPVPQAKTHIEGG